MTTYLAAAPALFVALDFVLVALFVKSPKARRIAFNVFATLLVTAGVIVAVCTSVILGAVFLAS